MATSSDNKSKNFIFYMTKFPESVDGTINIINFLEASTDLISLVERFGKVFAPVKYDMQGNLDKIKKCYEIQNNTCLLELMNTEANKSQDATTEGILWLNRAFLFFEILFQQIIQHISSNNYNIGMTKMFITAYEGSVKRYHNWVTQQLFSLICKMSPTLPQMMDVLNVQGDVESFSNELVILHQSLNQVRCKIDEYFKVNRPFMTNKH